MIFSRSFVVPLFFFALIATTGTPKVASILVVFIFMFFLVARSIIFNAITTGIFKSMSCVTKNKCFFKLQASITTITLSGKFALDLLQPDSLAFLIQKQWIPLLMRG